MACVAQRSGYHLGATVVTIQAGLSDDDAEWRAHIQAEREPAFQAVGAPIGGASKADMAGGLLR